jgi:PHP domain
MPAVALTDTNGMYAAVPFYQAARAAGVKPIVGVVVEVEGRSGPSTSLRASEWRVASGEWRETRGKGSKGSKGSKGKGGEERSGGAAEFRASE